MDVMRITGAVVDPATNISPIYNPGDGARSRYETIGSRIPVWPRQRSGEIARAFLVSGQSTSANWGNGTFYTSTSAASLQLDVFTGMVYAAADPVFSCDGTGASPFSALGDAMILREAKC